MQPVKKSRYYVLLISLTAIIIGAQTTAALASTAPGLGTAGSYAILAGTPSITNTGPSVVSGSVGIHPGSSVIGFTGAPLGTVTNGTIQSATPAALTAKSDLTAAYGAAASSPCNFNKTGQNLGGMTLTPGTYCQTTAPTLTGVLTLSGNGIFIFQLGSTLVTATGSSVVLANGAQPCNVFWQVSSSATINTTASFVGTVMALTSITVSNGAVIQGRLLARNGSVTLINDRITAPTGCNASTVVPRLPSAGVGPAAPHGLPWLPIALVGLTAAALAASTTRVLRSRR
jgi:Ice-binding-like